FLRDSSRFMYSLPAAWLASEGEKNADDEINNRRIKRIAREHKCTIPDVNKALDAHPIRTEREKYLARLLALELVEMDELGEVFREKAIAERDVAAGALLTKIHERRATLLGINAPAASAVTVVW